MLSRLKSSFLSFKLYPKTLFSFSSHSHSEESSAPKRFDHVKYMRKLNAQQRKEEGETVLLYDIYNEPTAYFQETKIASSRPIEGYIKKEVLVPYRNLDEEITANVIERTEIEARIYNILRQYDWIELDKFDFTTPYDKLGLDSLDWTALLTSIEYEFHTVFNDTFYEHWRTVDEVVKHLEGDRLIF